jgi:sarcosine oxidase subunit beta
MGSDARQRSQMPGVLLFGKERMLLPKSADVVVIGGGVMGASTAYHLALLGCRDVVLLEKEPFYGQGATGRCAGGIRYQFSTEINIRLSQVSLPMLARFEEELGQAIDLKWSGYLMLAATPENEAEFRRNIALQNSLGVPSRWLSAEEVTPMIPLINCHGIIGASWHAGDGLADPNSVVQGYVSGARRLGVSLFTDAPVTAIHTHGGRVVGVETPLGTISTANVVNAAGPWAARVGEMAGLDIPVVPVRRQIVVTAPIPQVPPDFPFVIDFAQSLYFHREGEGILTGKSNPDEPPGLNQAWDRDWEMVHLEAAVDRMPLLEEAGILTRWAGLYEVSPDAHPILGRVPQLDGFHCINGFSGHGFMHGPVCGLLVAEEVLGGAARTVDIRGLSIERFRKGGAPTEYNVI